MKSSLLIKPPGTGSRKLNRSNFAVVSDTAFLVCTHPWISTERKRNLRYRYVLRNAIRPEKCDPSQKTVRHVTQFGLIYTEVIEEECPLFSFGGGGGKNWPGLSFENSRPENRFHSLFFFSQALMNLMNVPHGVHCWSLRRHHRRPYLPLSLIHAEIQPEKHTLTA